MQQGLAKQKFLNRITHSDTNSLLEYSQTPPMEMPPEWPAMNKMQCNFIRMCNIEKFKKINAKEFKLFDERKAKI